MTTYDTTVLPTLPQLGKATAVALAVAGAILVGAVLPAEYGIDPSGIGKALGLTQLNGAARQAAEVAPAPATATGATVTQTEHAFRTDDMSITLQPGEGAEVKAAIRKGEQFTFSWASEGGPVKADMHGEPFNAGPREFSTYWKVARQEAGRGTFTAPFDGIHGWFWRNKGKTPVTIRVLVSGFHDKLFRPEPAA
ncbi:hypothetical protein [Massilia putida]|uniref:hypothetical protein n=1 Tax=Massilia putida TaxID=1141883 RepID=UPI000952E7CB|nr:hypothetical protein [Massilia putida]